jgi:hypothetical protein
VAHRSPNCCEHNISEAFTIQRGALAGSSHTSIEGDRVDIARVDDEIDVAGVNIDLDVEDGVDIASVEEGVDDAGINDVGAEAEPDDVEVEKGTGINDTGLSNVSDDATLNKTAFVEDVKEEDGILCCFVLPLCSDSLTLLFAPFSKSEPCLGHFALLPVVVVSVSFGFLHVLTGCEAVAEGETNTEEESPAQWKDGGVGERW